MGIEATVVLGGGGQYGNRSEAVRR